MYNYFIIRFTNRVDGTSGNVITPFETEADALKEYFRQAGKAVDSSHLTDSVSMLTKEGFEVRHDVFIHDATTPETEPEEVPEG